MEAKLTHLAEEEQNSDEFLKQIYAELKLMARGRMALEWNRLTLNTTGLVHEAWLRLEKSAPERWRDRSQFFAAASEAMRRILVDAARRRLATKRGSGESPIPLDDIEVASEGEDEQLLALSEALEHLEREDPMRAQVVKLRFFSGMENEEIASLLDVNEKTVRRHWTVAKVWLYRFLKDER